MNAAPYRSWDELRVAMPQTYDVVGLSTAVKPQQDLTLKITRKDGSAQTITVTCGIFTLDEVEYFRNGGILHYVLRQLAA